MARIRSIKPELYTCPEYRALDLFGREVFRALLNYVEDNGVGLDQPAALAAFALPGEIEADPAGTIARVDETLDQLAAFGVIVRYSDNLGPLPVRYVEVVAFDIKKTGKTGARPWTQRLDTFHEGHAYPAYQPEWHVNRQDEAAPEDSGEVPEVSENAPEVSESRPPSNRGTGDSNNYLAHVTLTSGDSAVDNSSEDIHSGKVVNLDAKQRASPTKPQQDRLERLKKGQTGS